MEQIPQPAPPLTPTLTSSEDTIAPPVPPPDFSSVFWDAQTNQPKRINDIDGQQWFVKPENNAADLVGQASDRKEIYKQIKRAIKDENRAAHPSSWRRRLLNPIWKVLRACCCTGCLGVLGRDGCCLRWNEDREKWKELGKKCWHFVSRTVWGEWVMEYFYNFRSGWLIVKMFLGAFAGLALRAPVLGKCLPCAIWM
jgi:hypothetical protein